MDSDARSARAIHPPPFLLRGSHAAVGARARRSARPRTHTAGAPCAAIPGRRRRRVTALTPPPVVLLVHFGRRPRVAARDSVTSLPLFPSSLVADRFIHDSRGFGFGVSRLARALFVAGERPTIARTRARLFTARGASSLCLLKRPSARRGPGIVSVDRNVRSKCRCSCVLQFTS